jgi:hypothetical protein
MIIIAYEPIENIKNATNQAQELLKKYAGATNFELKIIQAI